MLRLFATIVSGAGAFFLGSMIAPLHTVAFVAGGFACTWLYLTTAGTGLVVFRAVK